MAENEELPIDFLPPPPQKKLLTKMDDFWGERQNLRPPVNKIFPKRLFRGCNWTSGSYVTVKVTKI